jgi:hypothetical protein
MRIKRIKRTVMLLYTKNSVLYHGRSYLQTLSTMLQAVSGMSQESILRSTECRIDANNETAKAHCATFKEEAPKANAVQNELKKLKDYLASLTIVVQDVQEVDRDTIVYGGRSYKRKAKLSRFSIGVILQSGGAISIPGNEIHYRRQNSTSVDDCWEHVLSK